MSSGQSRTAQGLDQPAGIGAQDANDISPDCPAAKLRPSGLNVAETVPRALDLYYVLPFLASQIAVSPSSEAVSTRVPSATEKRRVDVSRLVQNESQLPEAAFQTRAVPSRAAVITRLPSG